MIYCVMRSRGRLPPRLTRMAKTFQRLHPKTATQRSSQPRARREHTASVGDGKDSLAKRIVVADEFPLCRYGLQQFLTEQPHLTCSDEAATADALLRALAMGKPDFLVMELRFSDADGIELIEIIQETYPALPILVFSALEETVYAQRALRAGACGFLRKTEPLTELLNAVQCILEGELYLSRKMSALILHQSFRGKHGGDSRVKGLSDRQLYVFQLLGAGLTSRKIAMQLGVSVKTIESHRENIKRKLGIRDGAELVRHAVQFVDPPLRALAESLTACAPKSNTVRPRPEG
jgi:DNA-binding NarL/FixJ family response regulator